MDSLRSAQEMVHTSTEVEYQSENKGTGLKLEKIEIKDEPLTNVDDESMPDIKVEYREPSIITLHHAAVVKIHEIKNITVKLKRLNLDLYKCSSCNLSSWSNTKMRLHSKSHVKGYMISSSGKYQCKHCNMSFTRLAAIKTHLRKHNIPCL